MGRTHLDLHHGELDAALGAAPVFDKTTEITAVIGGAECATTYTPREQDA